MADYRREVERLLKDHGCRFVRHGKGSHEIWETSSGFRFTVPAKIRIRHTANGILKDAGISRKL
jgi:predicted RNA binding protein YcfA (HicA-like mRNA interferase family)